MIGMLVGCGWLCAALATAIGMIYLTGEDDYEERAAIIVGSLFVWWSYIAIGVGALCWTLLWPKCDAAICELTGRKR